MRGTSAQHSSKRSGDSRSSLVESLAAVAVAVLLVASVFASAMDAPDVDTIQVQVTAGDTLWAIARAHPVEGMSTAQSADLIAEANGLASARIAPGMTLSVPVQADGREFLAMR